MFYSICNNKVSHFPSNALQNTPVLNTLDLSNNRIDNITKDLIDRAPMISKLNLAGNQIDCCTMKWSFDRLENKRYNLLFFKKSFFKKKTYLDKLNVERLTVISVKPLMLLMNPVLLQQQQPRLQLQRLLRRQQQLQPQLKRKKGKTWAQQNRTMKRPVVLRQYW